jgi:Fe(3+) dicitrate transport protein
MTKLFTTIFLAFFTLFCVAKEYPVSGQVKNKTNGKAISGVEVEISFLGFKVVTDSAGKYLFPKVSNGTYTLYFVDNDTILESKKILVKDTPLIVPTVLLDMTYYLFNTVAIIGEKNMMGLRRLRGVEGTAIYEGKKNEVVVLDGLNLSLGTNSSRQLFAKVPGMNIWESDAAGLQLGVAARGLDPNRTSNFNTRQNGYDMSADALGYPESYYVPPAEAVEQIEVVRGAASLQYGSQFGGMLNYVLKKAPKDKKIEWNSYTTAGAYKLVSSFNSIGGTIKYFNYYGYYNYKQGAGWRPNSDFKLHNAYASLGYQCTEKLSIQAEYTFSNYVAQQPGGLTDIQFEANPTTIDAKSELVFDQLEYS